MTSLRLLSAIWLANNFALRVWAGRLLFIVSVVARLGRLPDRQYRSQRCCMLGSRFDPDFDAYSVHSTRNRSMFLGVFQSQNKIYSIPCALRAHCRELAKRKLWLRWYIWYKVINYCFAICWRIERHMKLWVCAHSSAAVRVLLFAQGSAYAVRSRPFCLI